MRGFVLGAFVAISAAVICYGSPANPAMAPYIDFYGEDINSDEHGQGKGTRATNCSCGWTNKARIVGGKETLKNEYPLMAGIMHRNKRFIFCGASIITNRHILTAAHCPHEYPGAPLSVVIGEHDQSVDVKQSGAEIIDVAQVIEHEKYNDDTFHYDIALFVLSKKITFTQTVGPACLPTKRMNLLHQYVKVLGWGTIFSLGPTSPVLLKTNLRIIPLETCANSYVRDIPTENPHQICTFLRSKDSCQGDSGGPVVWLDPDTNRYTLVALVSYGKKCGLKSPSLNTDVSFFLDWIQEKIQATDASVQTCS